MIIDKLENADKYYFLGTNYKKGLEFLKNADLSTLNQGKHQIDDERVWANLQICDQRDEKDALFEIHKRYSDIQYIISGCEKMLWTNVDNFIPNGDFNTNDDIQFGKIADNSSCASLLVNQGYFVIFTPDDAHKPLLKISSDINSVKKIVVKIEV